SRSASRLQPSPAPISLVLAPRARQPNTPPPQPAGKLLLLRRSSFSRVLDSEPPAGHHAHDVRIDCSPHPSASQALQITPSFSAQTLCCVNPPNSRPQPATLPRVRGRACFS